MIYRYVYAVKPKKILVTAPCFAEYEGAWQSLWASYDVPETAVYSLDHQDFCIKEDILTLIEREMPEVVFVCNPNNPTGVLIPVQILASIAECCKDNKIRLFLDECFMDFTGREEENSLVEKLKEYPNLMILKAFTKMYAMAGVRLGFGLTEDTELIDRMYQAGPPWNVSVLASAAGKAALKEDDFVKETVQYIRKEKEYLYQALDTLGVQYWKSAANYILLKADRDLKERLIATGILIRDCSNYRNLSEGYFRIAVKSHADNEKLTAALKVVLER